MSKLVDLTGKKFGRLVVLRRSDIKTKRHQSARWTCQCDCGNIIEGYSNNLRNGLSKSCGCLQKEIFKNYSKGRKGKNHGQWKGGKHKCTNGYVEIYMADHPNSRLCRSTPYIFEHTFIMSEHLGRPLYPWESVHHKNGIRNDNRLENLELHTRYHGKGQAVEDMIQFCKEYLAIYSPNSV